MDARHRQTTFPLVDWDGDQNSHASPPRGGEAPSIGLKAHRALSTYPTAIFRAFAGVTPYQFLSACCATFATSSAAMH